MSFPIIRPVSSPRRVFLVTYSQAPGLSDDDRPLLDALWRRGVKGEPAVWDDPKVDWKAADLVVLRSTWDYFLKPAEFAAWVARLEAAGVPLANPAAVVRANWDKSYLKDLEAKGVSTVPTEWVAKGERRDLGALLASRGWTSAVVKPVVSGAAFLTKRVAAGEPGAQEALDEAAAHSGAMVQPYLAEIAAEGEWSFVFLGAAFSHAVLKSPARGDFRVQEAHGGKTKAVEAPAALLAQARAALDASPGPTLYARVDGVRRGGELCVVEVELIEPFLYLAHAPGSLERLADAVTARLSSGTPPSPRR